MKLVNPVFNPSEDDVESANRFDDWQNHPCFYVSVVNGKQWNALVGPFRIHRQALDLVERTRQEAEKVDPYAHFYEFGTVKMPNGFRTGLLNARLGLEI